MNENKFHLGLCMAGSISAGAFTAGVMDFLIETLSEWEEAKKNAVASVPQHQVIIDLMCGASGGGITSAMSLFALQDKVEPVRLNADRKTYTVPKNNIYWNSWVELAGSDVFGGMLDTSDIEKGYIPSVLNSAFIDAVAKRFGDYILDLANRGGHKPPFLGLEPEMFVTLFNVTGINYELSSMSATSESLKQYITDHRDISHFRLTDNPYRGDGRMHISLSNVEEHLETLIQSAMATGAFPLGLRARMVNRENKYIWDNPFFNRGKFNKDTIYLGEEAISSGTYTSINGDGGTANNEPVELAKDILLTLLEKLYKEADLKGRTLEKMNQGERYEALKQLNNTSILLIDPFPSIRNDIAAPEYIGPPEKRSDGLLKYTPDLIFALHSQLIFDAKEALEAYNKANYGLHVIAPSRDGVIPAHAIACGSLGGFGGFLEREFRVHDYFLGRHNCQSFLRKYFVANLNEPEGTENYYCIEAVIRSYKKNEEARKRFAFTDEHGETWVPIIPDTSLQQPLALSNVDGKPFFKADNILPVYALDILPADFLQKYESRIARRYSSLANNLLNVPWYFNPVISIITFLSRCVVRKKVVDAIGKDFRLRGLMKGTGF